MANTLDTNINVNTNAGNAVNQFKALKNELRAAIGELAGLAEGTEAFNAQAARVGQLRDQVADLNATVAAVSGSPIENLSGSFGLLSGQVNALDFDGATTSLSTFANQIKSFSFKDLTEGATKFIGTLGTLGKALLSNPIFIFAGVITAIGAALFSLKDKIAGVGKFMDSLGNAVDEVSHDFKRLSDAIFGTSIIAQEKTQKTIEGLQKEEATLKSRYDKEIELAKAAGKDVAKIEEEKINATVDTNQKIIDGYAKLKSEGARLTEDQKKELKQANDNLQEALFQRNLIGAKADGKYNENSGAAVKLAKELAINNFKEGRERDLEALRIQQEAQLKGITATEGYGRNREAIEKAFAEQRQAINDKYDKIDKDKAEAKNEKLQAEYVTALGNVLQIIDDNDTKVQDLEDKTEAERIDRQESREKDNLQKRLDQLKASGASELELKVFQQDALNAIDTKYGTLRLNNEKAQQEAFLQAQKEFNEKSFDNANAIAVKEKQLELNKAGTVKERYDIQREIIQLNLTKELQDIQRKYDRELDAQKKLLDAKLITEEEYNKRIQVLNGQKNAETKNANAASLEETKQTNVERYEETVSAVNGYAQMAGNAISQVLSAIQETRNQKRQEELTAIQATATEEQRIIQEQLNQGLITKEQADQLKYKSEVKRINDENKAKEKAFEEDKKMRIAQATIATITGSIQAFAGAMSLGYPAGPIVGGIMAGVVTALGAVSISNIKKQKYQATALPAAPAGNAGEGGGLEGLQQSSKFKSETIGQAGTTNGGNGEAERKAQRVYVLESDITDTQKRVKTIESQATFG